MLLTGQWPRNAYLHRVPRALLEDRSLAFLLDAAVDPRPAARDLVGGLAPTTVGWGVGASSVGIGYRVNGSTLTNNIYPLPKLADPLVNLTAAMLFTPNADAPASFGEIFEIADTTRGTGDPVSSVIYDGTLPGFGILDSSVIKPGASNLTVGQTYALVLRRAGVSNTLYSNGASLISGNGGGSKSITICNLYILGATAATGVLPFIALWNRALSPDECIQLSRSLLSTAREPRRFASSRIASTGAASLVRVAGDSVNVSESTRRPGVWVRSQASTADASDSPKRVVAAVRTAASIADASENIRRPLSAVRSQSSAAHVSESTKRPGAWVRVVGDVAHASEATVRLLFRLLVVIVNDVVHASEVLRRVVAAVRISADVAHASETTLRPATLVRRAADVAHGIESAIRRATIVRIVSSVATASERAIATIAGFIALGLRPFKVSARGTNTTVDKREGVNSVTPRETNTTVTSREE